MRGTQFSELVIRVRDESGRDNNVSVGVDDIPALQTLINRVYSTMTLKYDWPFLRTVFDKSTVNPGQRYYDLPTNLDIERVEQVKVWFNSFAYPIERGINIEDYNLYDPDNDQRSDPVLKWDFRYVEAQSADQVEVWPLPATTQQLQMIGIRKITRLVNDSDVCLLDDDLIVLYCVAELCMREKLADAQGKLQAANDHFNWLKSRYRGTLERLSLGLGYDPQRGRHPRAIVRIAGT